MPYVDLNTPTGSVSLYYNILTPTDPSAPCIDCTRPTIFFLHSLYMAQEIFEPQASDPLLRRFNLVLVDLRAHGQSKGRLGNPYTPTQTADDVFRVMKHLNLPACHVFGLSIGSSAALELAIAHPDVVLSLTLCGPLSPHEPEMALSGRQEIWDCWLEGIKDAPAVFVEECVLEAVYGTQQMMFNNGKSGKIESLMKITAGHCSQNWGWTEDKKADGYGSIATWFAKRRILTVEDYEKIRCPVLLIHGNEDLPYPTECVRATERMMKEAGVDVDFVILDGPHYVSFANPLPINQLLHDMVAQHSKNLGPMPEPPLTGYMKTPFHDALESAGYFESEDDSDDEDMEYYTES